MTRDGKLCIRLPYQGWAPRPYQQALWDYLEGGGKRAVAICHRRWGKDDVALHWSAIAAHTGKPANIWHCLPLYEQARKAIWTAVNSHTGRRRIDEAFPPEIRESTNDGQMFIRFRNGSTWQVVGSDNYESLVGTGAHGIVFSEWSRANPAAWAYLAPILEENNGWALFITTPIGRNHAKHTLDLAQSSPGWFAEVQTVLDSGALPLEVVETARREYHSIYGVDAGDALIQQEYFCSFEAAILGAYYGKLIAQAERQGRIRTLTLEPDLPIHTVWDLGKGSNLAVWAWQVIGNEIRVLAAVQGAHDEVIPDMVERLDSMGLKSRWGRDYVPHDAKVKELGTGRTRIETLARLGRNPVLVPDHKVDDGIAAARTTLPICWFDETGCADGLEALRQYRAAWDEERKVFKNIPEHDWSSHFADAFRYLAMAWRELKAAPPPPKPQGRTIYEMTLNEAWKLREPDRPDRI